MSGKDKEDKSTRKCQYCHTNNFVKTEPWIRERRNTITGSRYTEKRPWIRFWKCPYCGKNNREGRNRFFPVPRWYSMEFPKSGDKLVVRRRWRDYFFKNICRR